MLNPFTRLTVESHFNSVVSGRVLVSWALSPAFSDPGPYTFTLERGYSATDDGFVQIARTVDQPWLYDNSPVLPAQGTQVYYRVRLTSPGGEWVSQASPILSFWDPYDWKLAREIVRKELMLLRKRTGVKGWLFKRRLWGEKCPDCTTAAGHVLDSHCETCYGTGIVGGYYDAFEYWVALDAVVKEQKLSPEDGVTISKLESARGLAYPQPEAGDVWVQFGSDQRYTVQPKVEVVARHRGIDLVVKLGLLERPRSDSIYALPLEPDNA